MTSFASFTATTKVQQKAAQSKLGEFARKQKKLKITKSQDFSWIKKGKEEKRDPCTCFKSSNLNNLQKEEELGKKI